MLGLRRVGVVSSRVGIRRVRLEVTVGRRRRVHQSIAGWRLRGHCGRSDDKCSTPAQQVAGRLGQIPAGGCHERAETARAESCPYQQEQCGHEERRGRCTHEGSIEPTGGRERRHSESRGESGKRDREGSGGPAPRRSRGRERGRPHTSREHGGTRKPRRGGPGEADQRGYRGPGGARPGPLLLLPELVPGSKPCPSPAVSCVRRLLEVCCPCVALSSPA